MKLEHLYHYFMILIDFSFLIVAYFKSESEVFVCSTVNNIAIHNSKLIGELTLVCFISRLLKKGT